jgi:hypothetical protein
LLIPKIDLRKSKVKISLISSGCTARFSSSERLRIVQYMISSTIENDNSLIDAEDRLEEVQSENLLDFFGMDSSAFERTSSSANRYRFRERV